MEIEVRGHSGCQIDVVNESGQIFVYKSTADPKYLRRLALQARKQQAAADVEHQHIRVPKIYDLQENADTTVIKMQYVYSKNFIEFFEQAGFEQVDYLIGALEHFLEYEISKSELQEVLPGVFLGKFADIRQKVESSPYYQEDFGLPAVTTDQPEGPCSKKNRLKPEIADLMNRCQQVFDSLQPMTIPVGVCHGDLTFSNILFNGNNYYLIDFLDSFIETPLQDIVKIRQDTSYRWSQLMYTKPYDAVRLRIVCDKIDREIDEYFSCKYPWYAANYRVMQLMNILRILPYAHEEKVINYLVEVINSILCADEATKGMDNDTLMDTSQAISGYSCSQETTSSPQRSLIVPVAANKPEYTHRMPRVFQMAEDGTLLCIKALQSLDLTKFDHIYITILRVLDERYSLSEMLRLQFRIKGIDHAEVVVLDEPTTSQPDTIYQTICKMDIHGSIFIKDADCSFTGEDTSDNAIAIYPLEELDWVNPKNKSYVNVDDMYYITNIIEKRIVSHFFTAGGYSFHDAATYCRYYERFAHQPNLYLSHIIYSMLLDKHTFRPVLTKEYEDFEFKLEK